jgi:glycosyltransferase involved in cell wall biosynthesis
VADVGDWMLAADALLLPSRLEGCPLVFLEAAVRHCPVIASAAALEAFGDAAWEIAALAPDDAASVLVDQAAALLAAPGHAALIAAAAHARALAWDEAAMLDRLFGLLRGAVAAAEMPAATAAGVPAAQAAGVPAARAPGITVPAAGGLGRGG